MFSWLPYNASFDSVLVISVHSLRFYLAADDNDISITLERHSVKLDTIN